MTVFLTGDRIDRKITARDANRMLRAAQEQEAGLGNISAAQLLDVFENGHILVRNDTNQTAYPFAVMGYAQADARFSWRFGNLNRKLNIFSGQRPKLYKHWFRHCVLQTGARPGEVVPAAINGLTFAAVRTPNDSSTQLAMGTHVAIEDADFYTSAWPYAGFYQIGSGTVGRYGHAQLIRAGNGVNDVVNTALVNLQQITPVWRATLSNRVSGSEFDASLPEYNAAGPTGTIKVYDPQGICPDTSVIPTGTVSISALVEIYQPSVMTNDKSELPDICGILINVSASTIREGLQVDEGFIP